MPREKKAEKLSDEFGQFQILLRCEGCRHSRTVFPSALARIAGWDARLQELAKRMRCSKCDAKRCELTVSFPVKPRERDPRR